MKVKFENCDVDLYKIRKGTVVLYRGCLASYVSLLGAVWGDDDAKLMNVKIENTTTDGSDLDYARSDDLTWIEPS